MKNIFKIFLLLCVVFTFNSCEDDSVDLKDFEGTAISFQESSFDLSIPEEDLTLEIPVFVSDLSGSARSYDAVITSATDGTSGEYTLGSIVIPANSYDGLFSVDFDFSEIGGSDGDVKELVISMVAPTGTSSYNDVVTISYFREIVCNDLEITIISDVYGTETYWTLEDSTGAALVERFFPFGSNSTAPMTYNLAFPLVNGDYTLKIGDAFGDGQVGTGGGVTLTGSYSLICSIITHASGEGAFSGAIPDPFPGAPNADVEATDFTVNP